MRLWKKRSFNFSFKVDEDISEFLNAQMDIREQLDSINRKLSDLKKELEKR